MELSSPDPLQIRQIFQAHTSKIARKIDRIFGILFAGQWVTGILFAYFVSPYAWSNEPNQRDLCIYAAIFFGGFLSALPLFLILRRPGEAVNRLVITMAQILYSILFIHLSGGRFETRFHVFGSIALIAFYRDWRLLALATLITGTDHFLRGMFWSESVYGAIAATPWRALEHTLWVLFEDVILLFGINQGIEETRQMSTKQVELETALDRQWRASTDARNYRYALDRIAMVTISDSRGTVLDANENFLKISQYTREEIIGSPDRNLNSDQHPRVFFESISKTLTEGSVWNGEILNQAKDGSHYWVDASIVPIRNKRGAVHKILSAQKDITDKKKLEASIELLNKSLEEKVEKRTKQWIEAEMKLMHASKMSALGEMAGGMAHEINNPLAIIKMVSSQLSEILSEPPIDENLAISMLASISKTTDRIAKIVQGLRSFSRDGGNDPFLPVNVEAVVMDTISFCRERLQSSDIELRVQSIDKSLEFEGRASQISQVLLNLLNNARDAILELDQRWVCISAHDLGEMIEIRVTDCGHGIPKQIQERLFQPFFTTKEIGKGTGMGLSISMGIIKAHNGTITLDNESSHTCFVVQLLKHQIHKSNVA